MLRRTLLAAALALTAACAPQSDTTPAAPPAQQSSLPAIVLVHGAFMDGRAWDAVKSGLKARGRTVAVVNLPGRAANPAPAADMTLDRYRDAVLAAMPADGGQVVLVGHSFGGITISNVAEAVPERIRTLVYVAAYLPQAGQSLQALAGEDADSAAGPAFRIDQQRLVAAIAPEQQAALFCNDCSAEIAARMSSLMVEEPLPPLNQGVNLTGNFGGVDRVYVRTAQDRVVSPALQDRMIAATPVRETIPLDAGHSPFFTQVDALVEAIDRQGR